MIIKEHFEGPVGDYCVVRNTIKCLLNNTLTSKQGSIKRSTTLQCFIRKKQVVVPLVGDYFL